jgi:hypothetical protein
VASSLRTGVVNFYILQECKLENCTLHIVKSLRRVLQLPFSIDFYVLIPSMLFLPFTIHRHNGRSGMYFPGCFVEPAVVEERG